MGQVAAKLPAEMLLLDEVQQMPFRCSSAHLAEISQSSVINSLCSSPCAARCC